MSEYLYTETQTFRQKLLWVFLIAICGGSVVLFGIALFKQLFANQPFGSKPMSDTAIIIGFICVIIFAVFIFWFFYSIKLEIRINSNTIRYKFWPFIRQYKEIRLENVQSMQVEQYKPIREYGGWGYRFSLKGRGLALNTGGNKGLRIIMKDGFELLLSTQKENELRKVINDLKSKHNI